MSSEDLEGVLEIRDPEIDAESISRQIRENIRRRRAQAEAQGLDYELFVERLDMARVTARFEHELYYDLRRMSLTYDKVTLDLSLTGNRLPLIGPLVQRARAALHHLVLYYVNLMAGRQVAFNEYLVRMLTTLVKDLEREPTPSEVKALHEQVQALEARVQQLERQSSGK